MTTDKEVTDTPTDEQIEELREYKRLATRQDLENLMSWFFRTPTSQDVDRLEQQLMQVLADEPRRLMLCAQFRGNNIRYEGERWKELVSDHGHGPSDAELAIWLARTTSGYPPARPYCPVELVGRWRQTAPTAALWDFREDGTVSTDDERYGEKTSWCVKRRGKRTFDNMHLAPSRGVDMKTMLLNDVNSTSWSAYHPGLDGPIEYVFERVE
ncbi:MAG TPA: hypothetical protein VGC41_29425 [Kofleriaceae bacterium]